MNDMLRVNIRENLQVVIHIATKYSDILGPVKLIEMFESFKSFEGKFNYTSLRARTVVNAHSRVILLPWLGGQPEPGSRGALQVCPSHHQDWSGP